MIEHKIVNIVYDLIQTKYNNMNYDLCNYICGYILEPCEVINLHYEKNIKKEVQPCHIKINISDFMHGYLKCILHKKYKIKQDNIIPYLRKDIYYFTEYQFYNKELLWFINNNSLHYLSIYQEIISYVNSYSMNVDLGDNYKMYVIYYYNKGNSLDTMLNRIMNTSNPLVLQSN